MSKNTNALQHVAAYTDLEKKEINDLKNSITSSMKSINKALTPEMTSRFSYAVSEYSTYVETQGPIGAHKQFRDNMEFLNALIAHMDPKALNKFKTKLRPLLNDVMENEFAEEKNVILNTIFDKLFLSYGTPAYRKKALTKNTAINLTTVFNTPVDGDKKVA